MALNCGEKYDPHTNTWSEIAPMSCSRASACCAAVNGKIYVIGKSHCSCCFIFLLIKVHKLKYITIRCFKRWHSACFD